MNVFCTEQVHHTMGLLGAQAVCQNLIDLYWRRGDVQWSIEWRSLAGGEVGIRHVILTIVNEIN